jgi:hypothetical protein
MKNKTNHKIMTNEGEEERETKLNKEGKDCTFKSMRSISHQIQSH